MSKKITALLKAVKGSVGEVRTWGGKKYKKLSTGKWERVKEKSKHKTGDIVKRNGILYKKGKNGDWMRVGPKGQGAIPENEEERE